MATFAGPRVRLLVLAVLTSAAALLLIAARGAEARPHLERVSMRTHVSRASSSRVALTVVTTNPRNGATVSGTIPW